MLLGKGKLQLLEVTAHNWREVAGLSVDEAQLTYIESNAFSLAESMYEPQWISVAMYDEETLVGYAMHGTDLTTGNIWLDRLMIDAHFQGKGYAKAFIPMLIDRMIQLYGCTRIYLSIHHDNCAAQKLYEKFGFEVNGEEDCGETVMVLDIPMQ
ncbi:GNAT family N-acetyltransferase [Paenibacillus sp. N1-5-1-14]|uniref:GNAT family N-acetyltransferase n=1 Tax=Paenibacillus radicibacter TaxID=2972488 RepID=UPI002158E315|nr:GNAT family N-acetyltransferase [Paenibacillus radicibacter]MCR8642680.1 GNAT family N-acetyltransferase [Paenibacillus radicibacter]